jgi:hypothetical protein
MRLLNKPFNYAEKEDALRSLDGCICRICVSEDPLEIVRMVGFANDYLAMLAQSRMKQLEEKDDEI